MTGQKRKGKEEGGREREKKGEEEKRRKDYKNVVLIATYQLLSYYLLDSIPYSTVTHSVL